MWYYKHKNSITKYGLPSHFYGVYFTNCLFLKNTIIKHSKITFWLYNHFICNLPIANVLTDYENFENEQNTSEVYTYHFTGEEIAEYFSSDELLPEPLIKEPLPDQNDKELVSELNSIPTEKSEDSDKQSNQKEEILAPETDELPSENRENNQNKGDQDITPEFKSQPTENQEMEYTTEGEVQESNL